MLPIGPLMVEHRLIERMIGVLKIELKKIHDSSKVNPIFIENVVDFIRTYTDQTHHGKKEDILFRELKKREISPEHDKIMKELIDEHILGRKITSELVDANKKYAQGDQDAIEKIIEKIEFLMDFYPKHIEKEDKHFFIPIMHYFTKEEQDALLHEGQAFDRKMIHRKYKALIIEYENEREISSEKQKSDWIDYM
jgi:hemerythrin-like domain-containing protein